MTLKKPSPNRFLTKLSAFFILYINTNIYRCDSLKNVPRKSRKNVVHGMNVSLVDGRRRVNLFIDLRHSCTHPMHQLLRPLYGVPFNCIEDAIRACLQITWTKFRSALGQIWLWRSAKNRRRSSATLRILRLSRDQRWPEDEIQYVHVICEQALSGRRQAPGPVWAFSGGKAWAQRLKKPALIPSRSGCRPECSTAPVRLCRCSTGPVSAQ